MNIRLPKVGDHVNVIEKRNYGSGKLTTGVVRRPLSSPAEIHPRGNKVELTDGTVGRMVSFVDEVGKKDWIDPALREEYAKEIREQRTENRGQPGQSPPPRFENRRRDGGGREQRRDDRPPQPEPTVNPADLPGEDDLR